MTRPYSASCEACLMPFSKDPHADTREDPRYCSYCFSGGHLHADDVASLEDFQAMCYSNMRKNGTPLVLAKIFTFSIRFAPYWRNRAKQPNP